MKLVIGGNIAAGSKEIECVEKLVAKVMMWMRMQRVIMEIVPIGSAIWVRRWVKPSMLCNYDNRCLTYVAVRMNEFF